MALRLGSLPARLLMLALPIAALIGTCGPLSAQQTAPPAAAPASPPAAASPPASSPPAATPPATTPPAAAPTPPPAAVTLPPAVLEPIRRLKDSVEAAEKSMQQVKDLEGELQRLRTDVERIIYDSTAKAEELRPQLAEVKSQIDKLGPPPASGQPPESETIATERKRLNTLASEFDSAIKTSELAWFRAKQLIDRITQQRYQLFARNLFERRTSPLLPTVWRDVADRFESVVGRTRYYGGDWFSWVQRKSPQLKWLALALVMLFVVQRLLNTRFIAPMMARPMIPPTFFERVARAAWLAPVRALIPVLAIGATYASFDHLDLLFAPWDGMGVVALKGALIFAAIAALTRVILSPEYPWWRLVPLADASVVRVVRYIKAFAGVSVADTLVTEFGRIIYVPLVITIAQSFIASVIFAGLLVGLLLTRFEPQRGEDRPVNGGYEKYMRSATIMEPIWLKLPLWVVAAMIVGSAALGYVALSRFIASQVVVTGLVATIVGLAYLAIRAVTRGRPDGTHVLGGVLGSKFGFDSVRQLQLSRLIELVLTLGLIMAALPIMLLEWGFSGAEIRDYSQALLFGFEIGHFKISLARILIGIGIFVGLLFLTRLLQRWLRETVMHPQRVDVGISNSIDMVVGYCGVALAALVSVSYAGFDITSLAIVAGALSVGIGFGLQSIVNNFVSGLILLVERPIKVGDWVVVGAEQGYVRRISVRSTEIETFDRASLIVPNSELISGRVLNWTHRNSMGRIVIRLSVDGTADPSKVIALLLDVTRQSKAVLHTPEPHVFLDSFSADKLDFSVRATLGDVTTGGRVQSDLRIALLNALRGAGLMGKVEIAALPPGTPPSPSA